MKEKLIIKNFGPIKSVDLDLGKITILIGENASGKSTVAKVLAVCRYFSYIAGEPGNPLSRSFSIGLDNWGLGGYKKLNSYISYSCRHYSLKSSAREVRSKDEHGDYQASFYLDIDLTPKSEEFKELHYKYIAGDRGILDEISPMFYQNEVSKVMDNPFYLPTERGLQSIFSLGKNSLQNISDSLFNQFARLDQIARFFKSETNIEPLDITYKNDNGKGFIKRNEEDDYYSVSNAASGYQSTIPVVLLIKYYSEFKKKKKTFIIEEPEINIFPNTQKKLMSFFVENVNNNEHSFLIPTHSPYFLSVINDLLLAYKKGKTNEKETEKTIKKEEWLNPNDLSVYELKDGKALDIFNKESGLISDNIIDDVSDEMNDTFESLLDIK